MKNKKFGKRIKGAISIVSAFLISVSPVSMVSAQSPSQIEQISAGDTTACATVDGWVKCWGANQYGQVGNGMTGKAQTTPVKVADNANNVAEGPDVCTFKFFGICLSKKASSPAVPASAMAGKVVYQVSVGKTHACAIADGDVYCWGDNSHGQLGDRTTKDSKVPVAVDLSSQDYTPPPAQKTCYAFFIPYKCTETFPKQPKSALAGNKVRDIVAGDYFTCALAENGKVYCWGEGDNGRLGNGSKSDTTYPVAVKASSALSGQWGVKLGKISGSTVCVLAVESDEQPDTNQGKPFCWGHGMGGEGIPETGSDKSVVCGKDSPTKKPSNNTKIVYFDASEPISIPTDMEFSDLDNHFYTTGLSTDGKAYYWGGLGYKEDITFENVKSCRIQTCTGFFDDSNATLVGYSTAGTRTVSTSKGKVTPHYKGTASPNTRAGQTTYNGGGGGKDRCDWSVHYGYKEKHKYTAVGNLDPEAPASDALTGKKISSISGDVHQGLVCADNVNGVFCDANGTGMNEGQTGSNYKQSCTTKSFLLIFKSTTCAPAPSGPQAVVTNGWLKNKDITQLSTGASGYTCALASGQLGCWGVNSSGQLGTGDTVNKIVPTAVKFSL